MIRKIVLGIGVILSSILLFSIATITLIDRTPYQKTSYYRNMSKRLDSLATNYKENQSSERFKIGWAVSSITPSENLSMAGYGAREPMEMNAIHDSIYFKIHVLQFGDQKACIVAADLLIVHPELKAAIYRSLPPHWKADNIFFTATHSHSSIGGWAPGFVGELFAGVYNPAVIEFLKNQFLEALFRAESHLEFGLFGYSKILIDDLVYNRLVKEKGKIDPSFQILEFITEENKSVITSYSAHATCLGKSNHDLTGDYPGVLNKKLESSGKYNLASFMAGAVGSMGPNSANKKSWEKPNYMSAEILEQMNLIDLIGIPYQNVHTLESFKLKLPTSKPYFKITKNLAVRPFIFSQFFGDYPSEISVLKINNILLLGMPCDFSGELALPLYEKAKEVGLELIITSFNGGYLGYVIKDEWYDLDKYESRTMSWYGPHMGAYTSEVASRIIDIMHEN